MKGGAWFGQKLYPFNKKHFVTILANTFQKVAPISVLTPIPPQFKKFIL